MSFVLFTNVRDGETESQSINRGSYIIFRALGKHKGLVQSVFRFSKWSVKGEGKRWELGRGRWAREGYGEGRNSQNSCMNVSQ